jgi:hypothetical protein
MPVNQLARPLSLRVVSSAELMMAVGGAGEG